MFPLHPVTSKRPESPYGAKYLFLAENPVFQFFGLLDPYWTPIGPLLRPRGTSRGLVERNEASWNVRGVTKVQRDYDESFKGQQGSNRDPICRKTEKPIGIQYAEKLKNWSFCQKKNLLLHVAIQAVLTGQNEQEKYCGSIWTPALQFSVLWNSGFH